jgi:HEAT repeats/NACHT domain
MEPISTASMLAIAGKLVTTEVTKAAVAGIKRQLQPDEMAAVLAKAIESAQTAEAIHSPTSGLFHGFPPKAGQEFLEKFLRSGEVVKELQNDGKPDVEILVAAFTKVAEDRSEVTKYLHCLRPWMEAFVESYFQQIKGICFQVAKAQYLKQLARRVDDVKFVGIAVPPEEVEKQEVLAQIFVMPDVRQERSQNSHFQPFIPSGNEYMIVKDAKRNFGTIGIVQFPKQDLLLEAQKESLLRDRSAPRISAQKVINLVQNKAVVLGAPGSGKTVLLNYFALMLCNTAQSDPSQIGFKVEDDYLPMVVKIRDWISQPKMGLLEYFKEYAEKNLFTKELPRGFFEHWLDRGKALILLDGLDEVVDEAHRSKIVEQIESFLSLYQDSLVIITSRPAGYRNDFLKSEEFHHYTLEPFNDRQVATFVDHWYDSRLNKDLAQAKQQKANLQKVFVGNERIRLLSKNPLLLTIITLIHCYQADFPKQRHKLYEKAVETLVIHWDSGKWGGDRKVKLFEDTLRFLKFDDLLYVLKKLAYWIHTQGSTDEREGGTLIDKEELLGQLRKEIQTLKKCEAHEAKNEATRFIEFIQQRTGLLSEQGRDRYAFVHKTFQEYLTAEAIFDRSEVEDNTTIILDAFRDHLHDQHWREVLLLLVSKLKGMKAEKAIRKVLNAGSEYEQWLHQDLLFTGWCLTENPQNLTVVAEDLVGDILEQLVALVVDDSEQISGKIRGEVENIFNCFGQTTVEQDLWVKLQAQGDRIDRFRLIEFQAALGYEAESIDRLLDLLTDESFVVRSSAANALSKIGSATPRVVTALLGLLSDESFVVRSIAVDALILVENATPEVIKALLDLLTNKSSVLRSSAADAFGRLGHATPEVVKALLDSLTDESSIVRFSNADTLIKLGRVAPEIVKVLLDLLTDESSVRSSAADTLIKLGRVTPEVVKALLDLLTNESSFTRFSAADALVRLGSTTLEVVETLLNRPLA